MRALPVLTSACLLSLTTACSSPAAPTLTVYVPAYLPDSLLVACSEPEWSRGGSYRELAALAIRRASALSDCNRQLQAGRAYQQQLRAGEGAVPGK